MTELLKSDVFNYTFDFDQWPSVNNNTDRRIVPYNGSIFKLRHNYKALFSDISEADDQKLLEKERKSQGIERKQSKM